jgi:hypothetical protein
MDMPHLVLAAAVASLNLAPLADVGSPPGFGYGPHANCGSQLDPQFVRFVKEAPSSPRNPLLRLISKPDGEARNASKDFGGRNLCKRELTRFGSSRY